MSKSTHSRSRGEVLVAFDTDNPTHCDALLELASQGLSVLSSTERLITRLRDDYGLDAGTEIGFLGLCLAADEQERRDRTRPVLALDIKFHKKSPN